MQLKQATKRPQDYLKEMPPMPNFKLEVCKFLTLPSGIMEHGNVWQLMS